MGELEITWLQYLGIMRYTEQLKPITINLMFISSKDVDLYLKLVELGVTHDTELFTTYKPTKNEFFGNFLITWEK